MITLVKVSGIAGTGWPCWLATMDTRGDAVKVCSLWDDAALTRLPEYADRPVPTCWLAGLV